MPTNQQTVQQLVLHLGLFYTIQHLHIILSVDVTGLQLHLSLYCRVTCLQSLPYNLSERLDQTDLILIGIVPAIFIINDFEDLPVGRLLGRIFLNGG